MELTSLKNWKTAFLLSIIVPLGLLTTFRLTGLIAEPHAVAEITLAPLLSEYPRFDSHHVAIREERQAHYSDEEFSATFTLLIDFYSRLFSDSIHLSLTSNLTSIGPESFITNFVVRFRDYSQSSSLNWDEPALNCSNLRTTALRDGTQAFISLAGIDYPEAASFRDYGDWFLRSPHNSSHHMQITYEVTYFNGTVYKKIIQPFQLTLNPDLQYLIVRAVTQEGELNQIKFWIVTLTKKERVVRAESTIHVNSTKYVFIGWVSQIPIGNRVIFLGETLTLEPLDYDELFANYQRE